MRDQVTYFKHIMVCYYDLTIASMILEAIIDILINMHKVKLNGKCELNSLLGCDYAQDEDGTACIRGPRNTPSRLKMKET